MFESRPRYGGWMQVTQSNGRAEEMCTNDGGFTGLVRIEDDSDGELRCTLNPRLIQWLQQQGIGFEELLELGSGVRVRLRLERGR